MKNKILLVMMGGLSIFSCYRTNAIKDGNLVTKKDLEKMSATFSKFGHSAATWSSCIDWMYLWRRIGVSEKYKQSAAFHSTGYDFLSFSSDGTKMAVVSGSTIEVLNALTGALISNFQDPRISGGKAHSGKIDKAVFGPFGVFVFSTPQEGHKKVWHVSDGKLISEIVEGKSVFLKTE